MKLTIYKDLLLCFALLCTSALFGAATSGSTPVEQYQQALQQDNINAIVTAFAELPQEMRRNPEFYAPFIRALLADKPTDEATVATLHNIFINTQHPVLKWVLRDDRTELDQRLNQLEPAQTTLHDNHEIEQVPETMATIEERYQTAQQEQILPASSSEQTSLSDDRELKRTERTESLESFAKPAKRQRTQDDIQAQELYHQRFLNAIAFEDIPDLVEAYDQFGRSGGNTATLQNIPEFIEYLNGELTQAHLMKIINKYAYANDKESHLLLKKLFLMSPPSTKAYGLLNNLQDIFFIKTKNNEWVTMTISTAKKYSKFLNTMLTLSNLGQGAGKDEPMPHTRMQLEEPYTIDLSELSKKTLLLLRDLMILQKKGKKLEAVPLQNQLNIAALQELWHAAELLEVTELIKYMIAASSIDMVYTQYKGNFNLLDSLPSSAQNEIAKFSFLARPQPPSKIELAWREGKQFGVSIQQLIRWNRMPSITTPIIPTNRGTVPGVYFGGSPTLHLTGLHINDLTGLMNIPRIETVRVLYLSYNLIQKIDIGTFTHLPHLELIFLQGNPIANNPEERARIEEEVRTATNGGSQVIWDEDGNGRALATMASLSAKIQRMRQDTSTLHELALRSTIQDIIKKKPIIAALPKVTQSTTSAQPSITTIHSADDLRAFVASALSEEQLKKLQDYGLEETVFNRLAQILAKDSFLRYKSKRDKYKNKVKTHPELLPKWLREHFTGISIQDLIDYGTDFQLLRDWLFKKTLSLKGMYINDLAGLQNIPGIEDITILDLDDNRIATIEANTFVSLPNLRELIVSNNGITTIKPYAFNGLSKLEALYFANNQITVIEQHTLAGLTNLVWLDLENNQITIINPHAFDNLHNLRSMKLSGNPIAQNPENRASIEQEVSIATNSRGKVVWETP